MSWRLSWLIIPLGLAGIAWHWWQPVPEESALRPDWAATVGVLGDRTQFVDPFGVAVAPDGTIYVAEGAGGNRIQTISRDGTVSFLAGGEEGFSDGLGSAARFRTPSGLAVDGNGTLYVADTGNNAIRRVTRDGHVSTLATGFNGPVGVSVDAAGRIVVADTYNDRLCLLDANGAVTTLNVDVPLDTPTGVAVDAAGTIYVADTGNDVVRAISPTGLVSTIDPIEVGGLRRPLAVAVDSTGTLYAADETSRLFEIAPHRGARVVAGDEPGFRNGLGNEAQFRRPSSIASIEPGRLVVADTGNALVRSVAATALAEFKPPASPRIAPRFNVDAFQLRPLLWPLEPLHGPFEIAGTLGEARGEDAGRFHAGIDVRAEQGAPVLAVRDGVVTSPLSTADFGSLNEWVRVGDVTYVHLRAGRNRRGELVDPARFAATRDEHGKVIGIRVKRGARFRTGDVVGTVNAFNHVHLNVGWSGEEFNPLLFRLVQFEDTVPPTIARGGIRLYQADGTPLVTRAGGRVVISGQVQVVVDAWDQANGNRPNRRLGVYSLGYQVLREDGTPADGYAQPIETIRFDQLQMDPAATRLVYAPGSGIPFYGQRRTRFLYIVTNTFRGGVASQRFWDTTRLPPGQYTLRVHVADAQGNEALQHRDLPVTITGREERPGA